MSDHLGTWAAGQQCNVPYGSVIYFGSLVSMALIDNGELSDHNSLELEPR